MSDAAAALYRCYGADGSLLYVGISLYAIQRLSQHKGANWFRDVARVTIEYYPSKNVALVAEWAAIKEERPKHNIAHVDDAEARKPTGFVPEVEIFPGEFWAYEPWLSNNLRDALDCVRERGPGHKLVVRYSIEVEE